jgi:hypothetical protein
MLRINIRTKPIWKMRYQEVGDYYWITSPVKEENTLKIVVAEMENPDYEFLIALHELIESYLVLRKGITFEEIDEYDKRFEQEQKEGKRPKNAEAGEQKDCPYRKEHAFAKKIEKMVAKYLKVNFREYEKFIDYLFDNYVQKSPNSR